jgi:hypothetical protein
MVNSMTCLNYSINAVKSLKPDTFLWGIMWTEVSTQLNASNSYCVLNSSILNTLLFFVVTMRLVRSPLSMVFTMKQSVNMEMLILGNIALKSLII